MAITLLFNPLDFLDAEWLASAVGIAITFVVFIMGVPALIFQTFIAGALRDVYNERLGNRWSRLFRFQIGLILLLFVLSNIGIYKTDFCRSHPSLALLISLLIIGALAAILISGFQSLIQNFQSSRNIEQQLSRKIADDAIRYFEKNKTVPKKDLEDLGILARELQGGRIKNIFLEQCERLVEYLLNIPQEHRDTKLIGDILEESVCLSVTYDGAHFNDENMRKALDILSFTYSHTQHHTVGDTSSSYLNTTIGNCMKEIGIKAMLKDDLPAVMDAVEKLSAIEATSKEMFILGNEALLEGHVQPAVAVIRKLGGKVRDAIAPAKRVDYEDKRTFYFWLGLVAKIHQLGGSARNFAQRRLQNVVAQFDNARDEIQALFKETQQHFYQVADFDTADAVRNLEVALLPE